MCRSMTLLHDCSDIRPAPREQPRPSADCAVRHRPVEGLGLLRVILEPVEHRSSVDAREGRLSGPERLVGVSPRPVVETGEQPDLRRDGVRHVGAEQLGELGVANDVVRIREDAEGRERPDRAPERIRVRAARLGQLLDRAWPIGDEVRYSKPDDGVDRLRDDEAADQAEQPDPGRRLGHASCATIVSESSVCPDR